MGVRKFQKARMALKMLFLGTFAMTNGQLEVNEEDIYRGKAIYRCISFVGFGFSEAVGK